MDTELKQYLEGMETRLGAKVLDLEGRLLERMHDSQTGLETGSSTGRVAVVEKRLLEIELRLGGAR